MQRSTGGAKLDATASAVSSNRFFDWNRDDSPAPWRAHELSRQAAILDSLPAHVALIDGDGQIVTVNRAWQDFGEANGLISANHGVGLNYLGVLDATKGAEQGAAAEIAAGFRAVLVTRAEPSALNEAARTADDLTVLGLGNQQLAINGVFHASRLDDPVAVACEAQGQAAMAAMPESIRNLLRDEIPLRSFDMVGLPALRAVFQPPLPLTALPNMATVAAPLGESLDELVEAIAAPGRGLIMVMGKGGVGKTSIAAAIALGLVDRGHRVHLSTTDPAAHLAATLVDAVPNLQVDRIDPKTETARYVEKIMAGKGGGAGARSSRPTARGLTLTLHRGSGGIPCLHSHGQ